MKKHNTVKVVLITILVLMLLTWILPAAYYSSGYVDQGRVQMGLFDLFNYPGTAISYFGYLALFVLVVGAFYGVISKIGAYRDLLDKLANSFKKRGILVLSIIMILLAVLTSICGLQIGLVIFFPMLVSLILLMGYDKMVAALTLIGSTMIGVAGSTFATNNIGILNSVLSLDTTNSIVWKIAILVIGLALLIVNTVLYIKKYEKTKNASKKSNVKKVEVKEEKAKTTKSTKNTKSTKSSSKDSKAAAKEDEKIVVKEVKSDEDSYIPAVVKGKKRSVVPLVIGFAIIFIILVLSFIQWSGAFANTAFESATTAVTEFEVFGFTLFGKLLGTINAFGAWTVSDMTVVLIIVTLLLSVIYKVKIDDMFDGIKEGAKKAVLPAFLVVLIYTILVIVTYHPFQLVIYKALLGMTKQFNVVTGTVTAIISSALNTDPAYAFQSVLPYLTSIYTKASVYPTIGIIFQSIYGFTMLFAPTSVILMGVLAYLNIPYGKWLKTIWKLLLELLLIFLVIFIILILI